MKLLLSRRSAVKQPTSHRPRMLLAGRPGAGQTSHLAPAVLHALERFTVHSLDSAVLFGVSSTSPEEACAQVTPQKTSHQLRQMLILNYIGPGSDPTGEITFY